MAVVNSTAIGSAKKSAGELTYRRTRGRTIASGRIRENGSNTESQVKHRKAFGFMGVLAKNFETTIRNGFDKTKFGSERNNFVQSNKSVLSYLTSSPTLALNINNKFAYLTLERIVNNDDYLSICPIMMSMGERPVSVTCNHTATGGLTGSLNISREFRADDEIHVVVFAKYNQSGHIYPVFREKTHVLTEAEVTALTDKSTVKLENLGSDFGNGYIPVPGSYLVTFVAAVFWKRGSLRTESFLKHFVEDNTEGGF